MASQPSGPARRVARVADPEEIDRHDREAGRQLLVVSLPIGIGVVALACFAPDPMLIGAALFGVTVNVLVFVNPAAAIRLASGRFSELLPRTTPGAAGSSAQSPPQPIDLRGVLKAQEEGTPVEVTLLEQKLSKRRRQWLGVGLMFVGTGGCVLGMALGPEAAKDIAVKAAGGSAFGGLVLGYRPR